MVKLPDLELFKLTVEHASPFALLDAQGRYLYVNKSWQRSRGLTLEQVYGMRVDEIVADTSALEALERKETIVAHPVRKIGRSGDPYYTTYTPLFHNGELVALSIQTLFSEYEQAVNFSDTMQQLRNERNYYQKEVQRMWGATYSLDNIVGVSKQIAALKRQVVQAAQSMSNILIEGESGVGKELVAHSLHALGPRAHGPFIKVNCAGMPHENAKEELFGRDYIFQNGEPSNRKTGRFEMAAGGSLFLDEINKLSATAQPKLLRVVQERAIEQSGGEDIPVDVRLITATNVPLEQMVRSGEFRSDLYYRLNVVNIRMPALRERIEDVPVLAADIIQKLNAQLGMQIDGISSKAEQMLQEYSWPGNTRELQNVIERAMNIRLSGTLVRSDFSDFTTYKVPQLGFDEQARQGGSYREVKGDIEKKLLSDAIESCQGNKKKAAEKLGISRTLLYRKLKQFDM